MNKSPTQQAFFVPDGEVPNQPDSSLTVGMQRDSDDSCKSLEKADAIKKNIS